MNPSTVRLQGYKSPLDGFHYLGVIARRTFDIRPGRRAEFAREQGPLELVSRYTPSINFGARSPLSVDSDLYAPLKPFTDVVVRGSAWSVGGEVATLDTRVRVGDVQKTVRVVGDRRVCLGAGGSLRFSPAEGFRSLPITWDRAYGGRDLHAETRLSPPKRRRFLSSEGTDDAEEGLRGALSYPRNGSGRGYFFDVDRERLDGQPLPNLEDPADPVTPERLLARDPLDWLDLPIAACYDVIDAFTFPRAAFLIPPDSTPPTRSPYEVENGVLTSAEARPEPSLTFPKGPRLYNAASTGLATTRLRGDERVSLAGLHPRHPVLELFLPGVSPRMFVEPPNVARRELQATLASVLLEPAEERLSMTWAGSLRVAAPYPDEQRAQIRYDALFP